MFLSRVSLSNVRSIESMTLDFSTGLGSNRRWTLLLGENGCGKSSVLRATALLLAGSDALPDLLGEPDAWIRNGAKQCRIEGTLVTAKGESREISLVINRGDRLKSIYDRNGNSLEALDAAIAHADRNYFVLGYGVSRRPSSGKSSAAVFEEKKRSPRAQALATMFSSDAPLVSLEQWAMDLDYRKGRNSIAAVRFALDRLLPEMKFMGIDRKERHLVFNTVDGEVPLSQLSDGYQNMAAWCGDLLYRITEAFPDRKDPLNARGVLLIDELDLHLHPAWRRKLVNFLSDTLPNFQFLATTHSALTAQQSGEGELYVIRREGTKQRPTLVPFSGEPRKMMLHQLLMSPMFGLASMDSVEVEQARADMRRLRDKKSALTASERAQMVHLRQVLQAAPDWDAVPHYAREQVALLKDIKTSMLKEGERTTVSAKKLQTTLKSLGSKK
ncbi:MAG: AAA family ATPase [Aquabacterium sp.]|uniref:AAA family ATPase n=1 Tax=Aquabacterium sp. TaxID=1872578 RepID=UPI0025BBAE2C|nr:AAA family ATPase [Aquabacterium sp.]MBI5926698.1 AAA family ATPase [Aquabacterium sp.]